MPAPSPDGRVIRFVDADGVRLRTSVLGFGPPLLLITGLGASLDLGAPFERELTARGLQAVSFDVPGVGQSTPYRWPQRVPGIARTVERMLDVLSYDRVHVLGVSLGGVIAQQLAHQAPHRVRRPILAATGPGLGGGTRITARPATACHPTPLLSARLLPAHRRPRVRRRGPPRSRRAPPRIAGPVHRTAHAAGVSRPDLRDHRLDQPALAADGRPPTLVLAGDDDPIVPLVNGRILARYIPNARLHIVRNGGHLFLLENPAEIAALVAGFLTTGGDDPG